MVLAKRPGFVSTTRGNAGPSWPEAAKSEHKPSERFDQFTSMWWALSDSPSVTFGSVTVRTPFV